jgi:hypothetical protein
MADCNLKMTEADARATNRVLRKIRARIEEIRVSVIEPPGDVRVKLSHAEDALTLAIDELNKVFNL